MPQEPLDPAQLIQSCHPGVFVMVHQTLGKLAQDRDPHRDVEPVEDVLAARADPLGEGANLVPAVGDAGQILVALSAQVINGAALRLAVIAVNKADVSGLALLGQRPADDQLEVLFSIAQEQWRF
jgi:hypothetical protein